LSNLEQELKDYSGENMKNMARDANLSGCSSLRVAELRKFLVQNIGSDTLHLLMEKYPRKNKSGKKQQKGTSKESASDKNKIKKLENEIFDIKNRLERLEKLFQNQDFGSKKIQSKKDSIVNDRKILSEIRRLSGSISYTLMDNLSLPEMITLLEDSTHHSRTEIEQSIQRLYLRNMIDLSPGKAKRKFGKPMEMNGYKYYWLKILEGK
jgi:hypothetical protein